MIDKGTIARLESTIKHLNRSDGFMHFIAYFKAKQKEIMEELLAESGTVSQETLISSNARLQLYEQLINFDILLENDIN